MEQREEALEEYFNRLDDMELTHAGRELIKSGFYAGWYAHIQLINLKVELEPT